MKKLVIVGMLAAFATAVALPVVVIGSQEAVAAGKKKPMSKMEKPKKKKPSGGM